MQAFGIWLSGMYVCTMRSVLCIDGTVCTYRTDCVRDDVDVEVGHGYLRGTPRLDAWIM